MHDPYAKPTLSASVYYEDPAAALDWLEQAFGFERTMVLSTPDGQIAHSEMGFEGACIMVGSPWADFVGTPGQTGGKNTQMIHIQLKDGLDAHCERARAAGASIEQEPSTQFYGDRTYRAKDFGGHIWNFAQTVQVMKPEEWDKASGLVTKMYK
jgi:uncharacterized glyoxalase superfamily protein PhnB